MTNPYDTYEPASDFKGTTAKTPKIIAITASGDFLARVQEAILKIEKDTGIRLKTATAVKHLAERGLRGLGLGD